MGASLCKVNCCNIRPQRALYILILPVFCHCLPEFLLLSVTFIILQPSGGKLPFSLGRRRINDLSKLEAAHLSKLVPALIFVCHSPINSSIFVCCHRSSRISKPTITEGLHSKHAIEFYGFQDFLSQLLFCTGG